MEANNSSESELEYYLSIKRDEMESMEIIKFGILTAIRTVSIFCSVCTLYLTVRYKCVRNKVNIMLTNLCFIIAVYFSYSIAYHFINRNDSIPDANLSRIITFTYYVCYISFIAALVNLSLFWILFVLLKDLFHRFDKIICIGWVLPYVPVSIFSIIFLYCNQHVETFYYYFIVFYSIGLVFVFIIVIYFLMMKLADRMKKNKLDYLLYVSISLMLFSFPDILYFVFELYFLDERELIYCKIYYVTFSIDFVRYISPGIVFPWLILSNRRFRRAFKKTFVGMHPKNIFFWNKKLKINGVVNEMTSVNLDEIFI